MNIITRTILGLSFLLFTSCGDSHDKLMNDQITWMDEMTAILEDVADGDLSSTEAVAKIEKLDERGDEFVERKKALNEKATPEELKALAEKYGERTQESFKDYMVAVSKLSSSDRVTKELMDAIQNMNGL